MRRIYVSTLLFLLAGVALVGPSGVPGSRGSSAAKATTTSRSNLTGVQLFFRGQPVDQIVLGTKVKKYSIELTGTGFTSGSSAVVDSLGVCPLSLKPPQTLVTVDQGSGSLLASFPRGTDLSAGLLSIKLAGPDGAESNTLTVDVISNPSDLSIDSISPQSGPIGTTVALTGVGLQQGNPIRFSAVGSSTFQFVGFYSGSATALKPVNFAIPNSEIVPVCAACTGQPVCDPITTFFITPGQYRVSVINANGMSNSLLFEVTPQ
jgi:hypothetical protein